MGAIENHLHTRRLLNRPDRQHIHNQPVVPEGRPTLRNGYVPAPSRTPYLFNRMGHIPGGGKLPFFNVDRMTEPASFGKQIRLAA
jgi:hypothetical protein